MQIGGHIELDETPWQAILHELIEESGFSPEDLDVLQFTADRIDETSNVNHPTPFAMNTHLVGDEHFHLDICYGFVAKSVPTHSVAEGESDDLRWLSLGELQEGVQEGKVLDDVAAIYKFLLKHVEDYTLVSATSFSNAKPVKATITYKRGRPGESARS